MLTTLMLLVVGPEAHAYVDPECEGLTQKFDDTGQQNFLLNYFALATTMSPTHSPVPWEGGHGAVGLELGVIPPLSCEQRLVLNSTKTEDTNKAPVFPRPRIGFSFPAVGNVTVYGGVGYVPPVTVFGTRNVILSGELGAGTALESGVELGGRLHATSLKTVAEIATPFVDGSEAVDDLYLGTTVGVDVSGGYRIGDWTPYLAVGLTDVSTFFYIGDDDYIGNNTDPFFGPTLSLGAQGTLLEKLDLGAEFYAVPGRTWASEDIAEGDMVGWHTTDGGYLYTARIRLAYLL